MLSRAILLFTTLFLIISCTQKQEKTAGGLPPEEALSSFELYDGLQIELVASEPLVADPVAMEVDELGRTYVLEMHGYPLDLSGSGVIKQLSDTDGDGRFDQAVVFADGLKLPTGLMRWKNGLIVVDVPDVLYLEDSDGDGKADKREVLVTGFAVTNPQHIANTPVYGLDNWIYIAHQGVVTPKVSVKEFSDEGSELRFASQPQADRLPVDANGRSIRFRPDQGQLEMLSGESQYGQTFDAWGHHFGTSNADHLFAELIQARYLARNPHLSVADAMENIPDHGSAAEVFPITENPNHQLLTDVGVITSSCGVTWYQGGLIPGFDNVMFVGEPVHNLVHADRIDAKGASFNASRLVEGKEFLASTDAWFRPVQFYVGPDGALYVIDYYRQIIEHPEWMSEEVNSSGALYNGADKGRIYRITPKGTGKMDWGKIDLSRLPADSLLACLESGNSWWRRNAQRMIVADGGLVADQTLIDYVEDTDSPLGLLHGLWALEGRGSLSRELIEKGLRHSTPGVRENAVKLAELHLADMPSLAPILTQMVDDDDPRVRFQLLCTLGFVGGPAAAKARSQLLQHDIEDHWVQLAALSAGNGAETALLSDAINTMTSSPSPGKAAFFASCASVVAAGGDQKTLSELLQKTLLHAEDEQGAWWRSAILEGVQKTIRRSGLTADKAAGDIALLKRQFSDKVPATTRAAAVRLLVDFPGIEGSGLLADMEEAVVRTAGNRSADPAFRTDALHLLRKSGSGLLADTLATLVTVSEPEPVQQAAIQTMMTLDNEKAARLVVEKWVSLTPAVRDYAMGHLLRSEYGCMALLEAVEAGTIDQATIAWPRKVSLMNSGTDRIRSKARLLLASNNAAPEELIKNYRPALERQGDPLAGAAIFKANCAVCHQKGGEVGTAFGPDLGTIRNRDASFILADIINPNRSIADGFEIWEATTKNGETLSGVIVAETAGSLTLKNVGGNVTTINRNDISSLQASDVSAMPAGLENSISVEQMSDLIAYLKK